ncbi:hypothetical protein [Marinicella rhabdoformis]|uniref:hypothetical protein n=1 Tax=Marinicella rhabdoformis TaxID=2580566 RepID=UPI0012AEB683|nr:hypothetical protein [Marinicella rhabdoformis]
MKRLILSLAGLLVLLTSAQAALIYVDRDDDLIINGDGGCDLRDAINSANFNLAFDDCNAGDDDLLDLVLIDVDGPIQLSNGIAVFGSTLIGRNGLGPRPLIIAAPNSRHFEVYNEDPDDEFLIANLHLKGGFEATENGGSILINSGDRVSIVGTIFEDNQALSGGAIYATGALVDDFEILRNEFINNTATGDVDDVGSGGAFSGTNSVTGVMLIEDNVFRDNMAGIGGAMYISDGGDDITLRRNQFIANESTGSGGALYFSAREGGQDFNMPNNVLMFNTAANNGGAMFSFASNNSTIEITNSTLAFNEADIGGAISTNGSNYQIRASTLIHNRANDGSQVNRLFNTGLMVFYKSIIANNGQQTDNCTGGVLGGLGDNIDSDGSCGFDPLDNNQVADPMLSGIKTYDNGFPGFEPTVNSPALDVEDDAFCYVPPGIDLTEDQNGNPRSLDGDDDGTASCDTGAIEAPANTDLIYADQFGL